MKINLNSQKKVINFSQRNKNNLKTKKKISKNQIYTLKISIISFFIIIIILIENVLYIIPSAFKCKKWLVMVTYKSPTVILKKFLKSLKLWRMVVIENNSSNYRKWKALNSSKKLVYLSLNEQSKLGYKILNHLKINSYSRKNIGYLYAIQHGAKEIYELDEDVLIKDSNVLNINITNSHISYGVRNDSKMINPYLHFGDSSLWPRGFKLKDINYDNSTKFYYINSSKISLKPLIYQGLINGNPDLDSIFFQTRIENKKNIIDINFSDDIYPLIYFPNNYIPINSKNTKYLYDIFPFLILPETDEKSLSDIWRGYILQKFAWGINGSVIYFPSKVYRNYSKDLNRIQFDEERKLFFKLDEFFESLNNINNFQIYNKTELLLNIIINLIEKKFLKEVNINIYISYLEDLKNIGYSFSKNISFKLDVNYKNYINIYSELNLNIPSKSKILLKNNVHNNIKIYNHYNSQTIYKDILLIINYNHKGYQFLNTYLKQIYNDNFPNIIFISPEEINQTDIVSCKESYKGFYSYYCLIKVFTLFPNFKGYLYTNDDCLIKYWNFEIFNFDFNIPWITNFSPLNPLWVHYKKSISINQIINSKIEWKTNFTKFSDYNLQGMADFYYLPNSVINRYIDIMNKTFDKRVFLETAVPTAFGIFLYSKYHLIFFIDKYDEQRKYPLERLRKWYHQIIVHPILFSSITVQNETISVLNFIKAYDY